MSLIICTGGECRGVRHDRYLRAASSFQIGVSRGRRTCSNGTSATFDQARAAFEEAWRIFLSNRTEANFREWREAQAFTAWKYRMWDTGHRLPTQSTDGRSICFRGASLTIGAVPDHVHSAHLEKA